MKKVCSHASIIALALGIVACSEKSPTGPGTTIGNPQPTTGTIVVSTTTTTAAGLELAPAGYVLRIDTDPPRFLNMNDKIVVKNVSPTLHTLALTSLNEKCAIIGTPTRQVAISAGGTASVAFAIICAASEALENVGELAFVSNRDGNSEIYSIDKEGHQVRLTNNPAEDIDPAWSPDGKRIAFASERDGMSRVYVMDADGSNVVQLTRDGRFTFSPTWSPDGKRIAFSTQLNGQLGIYIVDADGGSPNLTHVGFDIGWNAYPAWSPDGKKIAFVSDDRAYDFLYDLYSMNADGSEITPLIVGPFFYPNNMFYFQPAWSPNGSRIAVVTCAHTFTSCYPESSIAIANADGSNLVPLVNSGGLSRPTWSPDGSMIAYSSRQCSDCTGSIRYVTADGSRGGLVVSNGHSPSWRPIH